MTLVDLRGFEPLTSSMPWRRAPSYATGPYMLLSSWRGLSGDLHSLYAITGVPASVRQPEVPGQPQGPIHHPTLPSAAPCMVPTTLPKLFHACCSQASS